MIRAAKNIPSGIMTTFRDALLAALETRGVTLKAVSDGSGVSYEQLKKLKQRKVLTTNVEDAVKIAGFFGCSVEEFMAGQIGSGHSRLAASLRALDPATRRLIEAGVYAQIEILGHGPESDE